MPSIPPATPAAREQALRRRLGIPAEVQRVLIFAESSHWDPDWLYTSEEYFTRWVCPNLDRAVEELLREPRRVYSVECLFFLRLYWERRPAQQEKIRALVNEGRLRLTSSGVTTADTLVPSAEAILRDLLLGQEWLRANGMAREPRLAYFADSFGCSPALPTLLRAAGFDQAAITRIDGMYFLGCDYELPRHFPRPGSSAELLLKGERSTDFIWQGPDGAEVLCHWNAFTYGQVDMLAHRGLTRTYFVPLAIPARSSHGLAHRLERFAAQLAPLSRTPYLFCPIGMDFVGPIPDLLPLLDRYNRTRYPMTGLWAINAGLDDYLALVDCYRERLPRLELDPNPYWTGFYAARGSLKRECHELVERLLLAEQLALQPEHRGQEQAVVQELAPAWWIAATANHHDFITGTSTDRVVEAEQRPWLRQARAIADRTIARLAPRPRPGSRAEPPLQWQSQGGRISIRAPHYVIELAEEAGGAITRAGHPASEARFLTGPSNDLIVYRDSGGLWRMGHEFRGGALRELARASAEPGRLEVHEEQGWLEVTCDSQLAGQSLRRRLAFSAGSPLIRLWVEGRAPEGHTVTVSFATDVHAERLAMDMPGGVVVRPRARFYEPTFWPLQHFWHAQDGAGGHGIALFLRWPGAIASRPDGRLEAIAARNATHERAWGLLPIPAMPASGHERGDCAFEYALLLTPSGDWRANRLPELARLLAASPWADPDGAALAELAAGTAFVDCPEVAVVAKPAWRGEGIILRLWAPTVPGAPVTVTLPGRTVQRAWLCDARERDLAPLEVVDGAIRLTLQGAIATLRVCCEA